MRCKRSLTGWIHYCFCTFWSSCAARCVVLIRFIKVLTECRSPAESPCRSTGGVGRVEVQMLLYSCSCLVRSRDID